MPSIPEHYTDADVQTGGEAVLEHGLYEPEHASTGHLCIARDVLNAVASTIVARAKAESLREFADTLSPITAAGTQAVLRARADELEGGAA